MTSQRLDGLAVSLWQLRFSGTLEIDDQSAGDLRLDGTIVVLAAGRAGDAAFKVLDSGEVRRTNVLRISDYLVLTGEVRDRAIDALSNGMDHGVLTPPTWSGDEELAAAAFEHERLSAFLQSRYPDQIGDESAGQMAVRLLDDPRVLAVLRGEATAIDAGGTIIGEPHSEPQVEPEPPKAEPEPEPEPEPEREPEESTGSQPPVDDDVAMGDETQMGPVERLGSVNDRGALAPDDDAPRGRGDGPKVARFNPDAWDEPGNSEAPVAEREQLGSVYGQPSKRDPVLAKFLEDG